MTGDGEEFKRAAKAQIELAASFQVVAISPEGDVFVANMDSGRAVDILAMATALRLRASALEEEAKEL